MAWERPPLSRKFYLQPRLSLHARSETPKQRKIKRITRKRKQPKSSFGKPRRSFEKGRGKGKMSASGR